MRIDIDPACLRDYIATEAAAETVSALPIDDNGQLTEGLDVISGLIMDLGAANVFTLVGLPQGSEDATVEMDATVCDDGNTTPTPSTSPHRSTGPTAARTNR